MLRRTAHQSAANTGHGAPYYSSVSNPAWPAHKPESSVDGAGLLSLCIAVHWPLPPSGLTGAAPPTSRRQLMAAPSRPSDPRQPPAVRMHR